MKKLLVVIAAITISIFSILVINQLVKWTLASVLLDTKSVIEFIGLRLRVIVPVVATISRIKYFLIMFSPLIASILFIELSFLWLSKNSNEHIKSALIIYQLINIGYLIFAVILGVISLLLKSSVSGDWKMMIEYEGLSYNQKLLITFLLMLLLLGYINILTKRVKKFIPIIK